MCLTEARNLSTLKHKLSEEGFGHIPFIAIVHEKLGTEQFRLYFRGGEIFLDEKRQFYKAVGERPINYFDFLSPKVIARWHEARKDIPGGSLESSFGARLLGAVLVIGPGSQGIVLEHRETHFGDYSEMDEIRSAVHQFSLHHQSQGEQSSINQPLSQVSYSVKSRMTSSTDYKVLTTSDLETQSETSHLSELMETLSEESDFDDGFYSSHKKKQWKFSSLSINSASQFFGVSPQNTKEIPVVTATDETLDHLSPRRRSKDDEQQLYDLQEDDVVQRDDVVQGGNVVQGDDVQEVMVN